MPFLHIADPVAAAAPGPTIGLLGAAGTVRADFHRERLAAAGLTVPVPPEDDVDRVDAAVFDELCRGVLSERTRADLRAVVRRLADRGADAVALCCTELELLLGPGDSLLPLLPSARLHVTAAVDAALAPEAAVV